MVRVLQVTTHNITVKKLLLPLIDRLTEEGYEVISACCPGRYATELTAQGYSIRPLNMERRLSLRVSVRTVWQLYNLMRREQVDIVHVHTPVAAALGRIAAWLARIPIIIYTAHGFYHHEHMRWQNKRACIWAENILGKATDMLLTQSKEDALSAVQDGINSPDQVIWIGNGVNIEQFAGNAACPEAKESFGLPPFAPVVGFLGPLIAEKGVLELLDAFEQAYKVMPDLHLLMAGDVINGDRDLQTKAIIRGKLEGTELGDRVVCPGYQEDINRFMRSIDLFVLPSHREGMPRSIIEAMASGKAVVATNIRGCREEIDHTVTGLLVPVHDREALAHAMVQILADPDLSHNMGQEGQRRARACFNEKDVLDRQVWVYQHLVEQRLHQQDALPELGRRTPNSISEESSFVDR